MANWTIDDTHTRLGFSVRHMMVSTVRGHFTGYSGTVNIDADDFTKSTIEGEVLVNSVDTGVEKRDDHLRTSDFFEIEKFPKITFKSTKIEKKGGNDYVVSGDLTIRDTTKNISFNVEFHGPAQDPWGRTVAGLSATSSLDRKDFGLTYNAALETGGVLIGDKVKLEIEAEFVKA